MTCNEYCESGVQIFVLLKPAKAKEERRPQ